MGRVKNPGPCLTFKTAENLVVLQYGLIYAAQKWRADCQWNLMSLLKDNTGEPWIRCQVLVSHRVWM